MMFFSQLSLILLSASALVSALPGSNTNNAKRISERPSGLNTNAKRFAAGLPPMSPRQRGTPTDAAKRGFPSSLPPIPWWGILKVNDNTGKCIGYISKNLTSSGVYTLDAITKAVSLGFTASVTGVTKSILIHDSTKRWGPSFNPAISSNAVNFDPYVGGVIASGSNLGQGSASSFQVGATEATAANATPAVTVYKSTTTGEVESAIWNFDASSKLITATWVNYDGSKPALSPFWVPNSPGGGSIQFTGDAGLFQQANPTAVAITVNFLGI